MSVVANEFRNHKFIDKCIIFSWIAVVATFIGNIKFFIHYYTDLATDTHKIMASFPTIYELVVCGITLASCVLLALCVSINNGQYQNKSILTKILGLLAIIPLFPIIESVLFEYYYDSTALVFGFVRSVLFALSTVNVSKGIFKKKIIVVSTLLGLLSVVVEIVDMSQALGWYIEGEYYLYLLTGFARIVGNMALYVSLLLFCIEKGENVIVFSTTTFKENQEKSLTQEQKLIVLKEKYELGIISDVEYQEQRIKIINSL